VGQVLLEEPVASVVSAEDWAEFLLVALVLLQPEAVLQQD